jgi:hypothetical protein
MADVRARIEKNDPSWETMVPSAVAEIIKAKHLFCAPDAPRA